MSGPCLIFPAAVNMSVLVRVCPPRRYEPGLLLLTPQPICDCPGASTQLPRTPMLPSCIWLPKPIRTHGAVSPRRTSLPTRIRADHCHPTSFWESRQPKRESGRRINEKDDQKLLYFMKFLFTCGFFGYDLGKITNMRVGRCPLSDIREWKSFLL